jgi:50S ribosomal subunit-associated GTPase HflX
MRYDFLRRLQKSSDAFKLQLGGRVEELISGMREAGRRSIGTREKGERETAGRLAEIEKEISGLRKILESCEKIRRCSR